MGQDLIFGFEIRVVLAAMGKPAPVRDPRRSAPCAIDREDAAWRC